ncbi:MAG: ATP synthase F1 subunit gamma [Patescibacteria group bacterium]
MNLRSVRKKIKSVDNVKKITKAMELVSAVKMKKFQELAEESTPYQKFLERGIRNIVKNLEKSISSLLQAPLNAQNRNLIVLISSNKGLCGAFNISLARYLLKNADKNKTDIVSIGKKGTSLANSLGFKVVEDYSSNDPYENISALFDSIYQQYIEGKYNNIQIFYNSFVSPIEYTPVNQTLLPVQFNEIDENSEVQDFYKNYLIEPSADQIMHSLLLNYVEEKIRFAVTQTQAGEHSARMMAMQNATNNATDILINLTLLRNKLRQENITNELLDMITAKESVEISN